MSRLGLWPFAAEQETSTAERENSTGPGKTLGLSRRRKHPFLLVQNVPTGWPKIVQIVEKACNETIEL
jgi:hypothetical protein